MTVELVTPGLEAARRQGHFGRRKRKMADSKVTAEKRLLQDGRLSQEIAQNLGVSVPTLDR